MHIALYEATLDDALVERVKRLNWPYYESPLRVLYHLTDPDAVRAMAKFKMNIKTFISHRGYIDPPIFNMISGDDIPFIVCPGNTRWRLFEYLSHHFDEPQKLIVVDPCNNPEKVYKYFPDAVPYQNDNLHWQPHLMQDGRYRVLLNGINSKLSFQALEDKIARDEGLTRNTEDYLLLLESKPDFVIRYKGKLYRHSDYREREDRVIYDIDTIFDFFEAWFNHAEIHPTM